jgi:AraC family transcriptional regulator
MKRSYRIARRLTREIDQLAIQAQFDVKVLAKLCQLSVRQLERNFRSQLGRTPQDWLNEQRLMAAKRLLRSGEQVKTVASSLGFKQSSHFCRHFKLHSHMTPSEFVSSEAKSLSVVER